jgi:dienelactone hydrolase
MRFGMLFAAALLTASPAWADPIGRGPGQQDVDLRGTTFTVYTYRPKPCPNPSLLLVFHGLHRNVEGYRDYARPIADKACMIVVAPLFDKERFPGWRFQQGGITRRHAVQESRHWTGRYVVALVDWVRRSEGRTLDVYMIGHSAGGQFLSRLAAFVPTDAKRIVIANPSTHVFPNLKAAAPFGMGGVYSRGEGEENLRRYLATPVTIFLGEEDTGDKDRNDSREAQVQGETRHDRGLNAFKAGHEIAKSHGWTFNWRLVELPGVGHSARKMFSSEEALTALFGPSGAPVPHRAAHD